MKPVLQALVVADHVYQDVTGKKIIAGTFNTYRFSRNPPIAQVDQPDGTKRRMLLGGMQSGAPSAYVSLTDVCDGTKLKLQFVDFTRNATLFETEVTISNAKRLATIELVFPLPTLPIREAGIYALELVCEGEILGSYRITAENMDQKPDVLKDGPGGADS